MLTIVMINVEFNSNISDKLCVSLISYQVYNNASISHAIKVAKVSSLFFESTNYG